MKRKKIAAILLSFTILMSVASRVHADEVETAETLTTETETVETEVVETEVDETEAAETVVEETEITDAAEMAEATGIAVSSDNFPDAKLLSYVSQVADKDHNGILSGDEIESVTSIILTGCKDATGIGYFTNLETLSLRSGSLKSLELSNNPKLKIVLCDHNQLTGLDISGHESLEVLACGDNPVENLNISGCPKLKTLSCEHSSLGLVDISDCPILAEFAVGVNFQCPTVYKVTDSDGSDTKYRGMIIKDETTLLSPYQVTHEETEVEDPKVTDPETVEATGIAVTTSNFPDAKMLAFVSDNFDLDHNGCLNQDEIDKATEITVPELSDATGIENFPMLRYLDVRDGNLTSLDVSHNSELDILICNNNALSALDLSHNSSLCCVLCDGNKITALDVSGHGCLGALDCADNPLENLDISGCPDLNCLSCEHTHLEFIDITDCPILADFAVNVNFECPTGYEEVAPGTTYSQYPGMIVKDEATKIYPYQENTETDNVDPVEPEITPAEPDTNPGTDPVEPDTTPETPTVTPAEPAKPEPTKPEPISRVPMYRLYNGNSGEHFYTASAGERDMLVGAGWTNEGIGWYAPATSNTPVYRLYNSNGGEHHYTTSVAEKNNLVAMGWSDEGIGWYSDDSHGVPVYRQYNPNSFSNNHNYSTSASENEWLVSIGWKSEGIAWYGVA